jgi:hypothetical protein
MAQVSEGTAHRLKSAGCVGLKGGETLRKVVQGIADGMVIGRL